MNTSSDFKTYLDTHKIEDSIEDLYLTVASLDKKGDVKDLTHEDRENWESFIHERRKKEFLHSRLLLKDMAQKADRDMATLTFKKDEEGKPYGEDKEGRFYISIAHTRQRVFCGLSRSNALGVDLEPVYRRVHPKLRKRIMTGREFRNKDLEDIDTVRIWTIKEAVIKLVPGQNCQYITDITTIPIEENLFRANFPNNQEEVEIFSWKYEGHWLAVAYLKKSAR